MRHIQFFFFFLVLSSLVTSCVDRDFDEPPFPSVEDPQITDDQIIDIDELKNLRAAGEEFHEVSMDKYIRATVVGDDQSGNIYKSLVLQDESGGISILLDDVELWNRYFVGKRVFIHLQNIWLGDYNNLPQIGFEPVGGSMSRIPAELIPEVITLGITVGSPDPKVRTIASLNSDDYNTLIQLNNVELSSGSVDVPWADAVTPAAVNHTLDDCNGNNILIRTSGFSNLAEQITPGGGGTVIAVLGVFGTDLQLTLRDLNDVQLSGERCDGNGGGMGTTDVDPAKVISISELLDLRVDGVETNISKDQYIKGSVISSDETGNFYKTLIVNDGTGGIAALVNKNNIHSDFEFGTVVYIHLQELFISDFNGLPQLGFAASSENVKRIPENQVNRIILRSQDNLALIPATATIDEVNLGMVNSYVELSGVQFSDDVLGYSFANSSGTSGTNHTLNDCASNEILLRTSDFADFADKVVPGGKGSIKGVVQIFNGAYQILLNYPEEVRFNDLRCDGTDGGGTGTGTGNDLYNVDFEAQADNENIELEGWLNVATKGDRVWRQNSFMGNGYAQATAFQDTNVEMETWLISPAINTSDKNTLSFSTANAYFEHDGLTLMYASDFSGNVEAANWAKVDANIAVESSGQYVYVDSGNIDLTALGSNIHIAFQYKGTGSQNTTTFTLDNIDIR